MARIPRRLRAAVNRLAGSPRALLGQALVVAGALAVSTPAYALSCDEILNMVSVNVPTHIIVQTMEGSGTQFSADDIRCLAEGGAPADIVDSARSMAQSDAPVAAPTAPVEVERPTSAFEEAEALGSDLPVGDDEEMDGSSSCAALDDLIKAYRAKKVLTASYGLYDILEQGSCPTEESRIKYYLAKSLFDLEMYHSAQYYFMEVVRTGPANPYFKYALPKLVAIAELTGNDTELLRIVHKIPPDAFPRQAQNHLYYLMGRKYYEDDNLSESAKYFGQISSKSDLYLKSKYFEGAINTERSKYRSAVKAFSDVYRAEFAPRDARHLEEINHLKDLSLINIARIYFEIDKFETADEYYSQVDRESIYWPQSLFERAYSNFYRNDLNLSLGLLLTTQSPYYSDEEFIPEATLLRALTYFQLCDFTEVERILLAFERDYGAMRSEIKGFLQQYNSDEAKKLTDQAYDAYFESNRETTLTKAFFTRILRNRDLGSLVSHMDLMDQEVKLIAQQKTEWRDRVGSHLLQVIEADRVRYKKSAGREMLKEMADYYQVLSDLMTQSEIIRFEVVDAQRADYEFRMQNPEVESEDEKKVDFSVSKTIIYWPFNGEFWKDELGYYRYTEPGNCN
jgi:tetratricopeptide (TPR) repeat protein